MQSWQSYLGQHTRAELIATWIAQDDVVHAQFGARIMVTLALPVGRGKNAWCP